MLWFLVLHIITLLFWCASLLYIMITVETEDYKKAPLTAPDPRGSIARFIFTNIATPAALLAIITGTAVFLIERIIDPWLAVKLGIVTLLALVHIATGLLLLRKSYNPIPPSAIWWHLLKAVYFLIISLILVIVLAKPEAGAFI